jgi:hypothetical protein
MCGVTRGNDKLGLSAIHVRTPVGHDTIGGIRRVALAPVAHYRVIRDAARHRDRIDRYNEAVCRREGIHAIGYAFQSQLARPKGSNLNYLPARLQKRDR